MSFRVIGPITGHGHLRKHLHRVASFRRIRSVECVMSRMKLFDCPSIAREQYAIFGSFDKGGEFPQEDLIGCLQRFASWCASGVRKKPLRLKSLAVGCPIEEEEEAKLLIAHHLKNY
ncbi:hypothetical protein J6590_087766 [Homalodisca vitripennis]|nr:hypothetical protein J6590_087766 [Homalodisca vitripennis]